MIKNIKRLIHLTETLIALIQEIADSTKNRAPKDYLSRDSHSHGLPKLYDKYDVMQYLKISESTYYRKIEMGELKPRKIGKTDYYFEQDLQPQYMESIRRGRI